MTVVHIKRHRTADELAHANRDADRDRSIASLKLSTLQTAAADPLLKDADVRALIVATKFLRPDGTVSLPISTLEAYASLNRRTATRARLRLCKAGYLEPKPDADKSTFHLRNSRELLVADHVPEVRDRIRETTRIRVRAYRSKAASKATEPDACRVTEMPLQKPAVGDRSAVTVTAFAPPYYPREIPLKNKALEREGRRTGKVQRATSGANLRQIAETGDPKKKRLAANEIFDRLTALGIDSQQAGLVANVLPGRASVAAIMAAIDGFEREKPHHRDAIAWITARAFASEGTAS